MKRFLLLTALFTLSFSLFTSAAEPLRVFIRSGPKSHGPGAHDHPSFLRDWVPLLNERGIKASGGDEFPSKDQLDHTDVLIIHRDGGGDFKPEERALMDQYTKHGGGIVVIHAGSVANTPEGTDYYKQLIGGSWRKGVTKWLEGPMNLYFTDHENPITKDCSNFEMDDEIYYDMDLSPDIRILAGAYTPKPLGRNEKATQKAEQLTGGGKKVSVYDIQPQMWMYEKGGYRAFVCIPGHHYVNFSRPNFRAILLRGIAWAGKRANTDEFCKPEELGDNLRYVEGGPTRPDKAAEKLEVHPEFNISLVAAEPLIRKAMNIDWDEKGRLWVCETPEYPNGRRLPKDDVPPGDVWKDSGSYQHSHYDREPLDSISWLEDTNGDGVMDKKHVFADKLELVTSFCFYKNGVIACSAPDIWFLEDTTGKGVCDKRTKLYTGLGTGDTHAVINNLRWGLDGWIYATHGYSAGHVTSADGSKDFGVDGSGVVRFKPDGSAFEQYSSRGGNTWGLDMTWDGQCFWTQPTSGTVFFHTVLPESVLAKGKIPGTTSWKGMITGQKTYPLMKWEEQAYVQIDQVGNYTAAAGCAIYEGGAWPDKWNYSYFVGEPTINIVSQYFVKPDGVSYSVEKEKGREETEFVRSKDMWFRPIEERIGPDGALYVVDFYNQAVIHNDTRGPNHGPANAAVRPDRDHYFGRIWKLQHKEAKKLEVPVLDRNNLPSVQHVFTTHPNAHVRQNAWRILWEEYSKQGTVDFARTNTSNTPYFAFRSNPKGPALIFMPDGKMGVAGKAGKASQFGFLISNPTVPNHEAPDEKTIAATAKFLQKGEPLLPNCYYELRGATSSKEVRDLFIQRFIGRTDDWTGSAIIAAASERPNEFISDCLTNASSAQLGPLVAALLPVALQKDEATGAVKLLAICAAAPSSADGLKKVILQGIAQQSQAFPAIDAATAEALKKLLANPATASATLPLVAKWDKSGALGDVVKTQVATLLAKFSNATTPEAERADAAHALVSVRGLNPEIPSKISAVLADANTPAGLKREIITALGETDDVASAKTLLTSYATLKPDLQGVIFDQLIKRPEWCLAMLDEVKKGDIKAGDLGPANIARLRTHPNKQVAFKANALFKAANAAKDKIIASLTPEVEKPGDAVRGKLLFTGTCAICHQLSGEGKLVGPPLNGMGAHGPGELLISVVDPNREVEPSFFAHNITRKNGEVLVGVIAQENAATLTLRNQTGEFEVRKEDIKTRENTKRSLMPEGFEALPADVLRDILAYVCSTETRFRIVNLAQAYTADTRRGLFNSETATNDTVHLSKFGNMTVENVPYFIQDPTKSQNGANVIVLKGGGKNTTAHEFPQKVEIAMNTPAKRLDLLSGIAGWGYPATKDHRPALKITATHNDGQSEVFELKNGEAFSDYNREIEVPDSDLTEGLVKKGQLRRITLGLKQTTPLTKLTLESYDNGVTPVVVAITADIAGAGPAPTGGVSNAAPKATSGVANPASLKPKEGGKGDGPLPPATPVSWEAGKTKVLLIGGGSSHNFAKFFGGTDSATLKAAGFTVHYTEDRDQAAAELKNADVAVISTNRKFFDTLEYRKALVDFVNAGKGVIMLHPGTWYGFPEWPELNAKIVGGGARGHDALGPFTVSVVAKDHPIMKGVPASFDVTDELYYINAEADKIPAGTASIEVLAQTSPSKKYKAPHPSVWVTKNDKAKIVGIALGHDERVHDSQAFQKILVNAVKWTSQK